MNNAHNLRNEYVVDMDIISMLNPAFCGIVIYKFLEGHAKIRETGLEYPLIYFILPLIFSDKIRPTIKGRSDTLLSKWLSENPEVIVELSEEIIPSMQYTKEALIYAYNQGIISINTNGNFILGNKIKIKGLTEEKELLKKASLLGNLFANSGDVKTIYQSFGVRV
ncbi:hypothetical protein HNP92_000265 [Methanococcus maripaludis]|uniref:Uncharacterized protein n=1 Tax=Methanococcus maripaludis TaxID=39152 RepID=A0A7J9S3Y5_METMI|nr:three component ABC system middle component [Methanococcus maripaludis]MBB6400980.1 hypothetical protein [Methanococcus maripaludis]